VGLNLLKSLNLTNGYLNNKKNNNNKVKSKRLELYELAVKKSTLLTCFMVHFKTGTRQKMAHTSIAT
jgi:hypothetical protein